jgi:S1-C subfamily serine protease
VLWRSEVTVLVLCRVTLADQTVYEAQVVGFDQDKDVAVLSIQAPKDKLRPLPVGVSADLLVGQKVYAIGNPVSASYTNCSAHYLYMSTDV